MQMTQVIGKRNKRPVQRWQMLDEALFNLHLSNIITQSERTRAMERLKKACAKEGMDMKQVPGFPG